MRARKIIKKLLFPPLVCVMLLTLLCGAGLAYAFLMSDGKNPLVYAIYALSFYTLCTLVAYFAVVFPSRAHLIKKRIFSTKYGAKYKNDINFKTKVSLYSSLLLNLGNVFLNIIYGIVYSTRWFFILAAYYATLAVMRTIISVYSRKKDIGEDLLGEWRIARACSYVMLMISVTLSGVVLMMMYQSRGFEYAGMLIYIMAAYAFYHITVTVIDLWKYRKYNSPALGCVKMVSFTSATISMLTLESAMFTAFGDEMDDKTQKIFIAATGAVICVLVNAISVYTIIRATRALKSGEKR